MSSPPSSNNPPDPANNAPPNLPEGMPENFQMEMNFFIPLGEGFPAPPPQAEGEGGQAQPGGGMMFTVHLQQDPHPPPASAETNGEAAHRPATRSRTRPAPSASTPGEVPPSGPASAPGPAPQRRSGGLPFSGPLNLPVPPAAGAPPINIPFAALFPGMPPMPNLPAHRPQPAAVNPGDAPPRPNQMVFVLRPDGSVGMPGAENAAAPPAGAADPAAPPAPAGGVPHPIFLQGPPGAFLFPFLGRMGAEPAPDPEKAKELLKSLPTVEKGLMRRVDRIYAAENVEEGGWKCGVCLEGWETEEDAQGMEVDREKEGEEGRGGSEVKRLPCNHLFHAECLEPWFGTKHTCPSCRLDLDPLRTLRRSSATSSIRPRPAATAARLDRQNAAHPYRNPAVPDAPVAPAVAGDNAAPAAGAGAQPPHPPPQVDIEDDGNGGRTINFYWDLRRPRGGAADQPVPDSPAEGAAVGASAPAPASATVAAATPVPATAPAAPRRRMGIMPRILASLAGGVAPAAPATPPSAAAPAASGSSLNPQPRFEPVSPQPANTTFIDPAHVHHHHHHHHVPVPHHHHHAVPPIPLPHFHIHRNAPAAPGTANPAPAPNPAAPIPHNPFNMFQPLMFPILPSQRVPSSADAPVLPGAAGDPPLDRGIDFQFALDIPQHHFRPPTPPGRSHSRPKKQLVQVPLEKWVRNHERELGWRCDLESCVRGPTSEAGDAFADLADGDRPKKRDLIPVRGGECGHAYHAQCIGGGISVLPESKEAEVEDEEMGQDEVRVRCGECEKIGRMWRWDMEGWEEEDIVEVSC